MIFLIGKRKSLLYNSVAMNHCQTRLWAAMFCLLSAIVILEKSPGGQLRPYISFSSSQVCWRISTANFKKKQTTNAEDESNCALENSQDSHLIKKKKKVAFLIQKWPSEQCENEYRHSSVWTSAQAEEQTYSCKTLPRNLSVPLCH